MNPRQFKRRQVLKAAGLGVVASAVAKPAIAQANPAIKWRLTSSFPKSLETVYGAMETIARFVEESTDNQFQLQIFAASEIVPGLNAMDAVGNGTVEGCHSAAYYYFGKDPTFASTRSFVCRACCLATSSARTGSAASIASVISEKSEKSVASTARLNCRNWTRMICSWNPGNADSAFAGALTQLLWTTPASLHRARMMQKQLSSCIYCTDGTR